MLKLYSIFNICSRSCKGLILFCLLSFSVHAQQKKSPQNKSGPAEKSFKEELKSDKQLRIEKREKRRKERAERKAVKQYHKRIQTKSVRKRMKSSRKTAIRNHDNKREPFLKRYFKKKGRVKRSSKKTK